MERQGKIMQDIRNSLNFKSIRWKIEKRTLERIGHVLRISNKRTTKIAVLGWLGSLEELPKRSGKNPVLLEEPPLRTRRQLIGGGKHSPRPQKVER